MNVKVVLLGFAQDVAYKRNHGRVLTLDLELDICALLTCLLILWFCFFRSSTAFQGRLLSPDIWANRHIRIWNMILCLLLKDLLCKTWLACLVVNKCTFQWKIVLKNRTAGVGRAYLRRPWSLQLKRWPCATFTFARKLSFNIPPTFKKLHHVLQTIDVVNQVVEKLDSQWSGLVNYWTCY